MFKIKKQINRLYISSMLGNLSLTGAWVAILAARGYSLIEIGIAETIFHITSLLFEIPSGVLADVIGRKTTLIISTIMRMIGNLIMILSFNLPMVCISIAFHALSYNFASGSDDALAYDSLKFAKEEEKFEKYASNQMIIYRLCSGISTLCAGFALMLGHKLAYASDLITGFIQILILLRLIEIKLDEAEEHNLISEISQQESITERIKKEMFKCFRESVQFLKTQHKAIQLMFLNSFVGSIDILLLFFLQAKLPECGIPKWGLGIALFSMELGGVLGAKIILKLNKITYKALFLITSILVIGSVLIEHSGMYLVMTIGGFVAAMSDDALQVRTNSILQTMFPSKQRATLISIESFTFSVIMIVLSPLAGAFFSWW